MAEQISHNVVKNTESASGSSPLVDAAANHNTTTTPTANGTQDHVNPKTIDKVASPQSQNIDTSVTNPALVAEEKGNDVVQPAAEPSAGEAAEQPANIPLVQTPVHDNQGKSKGGVDDSLANGAQSELGEDGTALDTSADPSVHSDTDASRADAPEQTKDGNRHLRTNSVKKATTFSRVSTSKSFLKSAAPAPAPANTGEKASIAKPVVPAAAKPRLIAKTGASLIAQKTRQSSEAPGGPDASKVWNKNRPTAPAPPKQFTDEELKQQYGIHLATRLQSDGEGKENKWADIDDEDDDWVPETVVWMDGTKSNIVPAEAAPAPKEPEVSVPPPKQRAEAAKPVLLVAKKPAAPTGPPKTILKAGLARASGGSSSANGSDKPTLKAKSPIATTVKSPWAPIPKVDTVPLIAPPTQHHMPPPPFATQDARAYEQGPPSGHPAREIAADTFDRAWRDGEGGQRELFNSTNGRYEPAPEGRRASMRSESFRKPLLLQRPTQATGAPAEPSSAFQSRTGSQTDGPPSWGRRRGSSVSQTGGPAGRRMSTTRSYEPVFGQDRRPSAVSGHDMSAAAMASTTPAFAQQNAWQQQMPIAPVSGPALEIEDPAKLQEKIMKEKKEHSAKLREQRLEKERLETEAAQERLKAKLAGLGNAGVSRAEREAAAMASKASADQKSKDSVKPIERSASRAEKQNTNDSVRGKVSALSMNGELDAKASTSDKDAIASLSPSQQTSAVPTAPSGEQSQLSGTNGHLATTTAARAASQPNTSQSSHTQASLLPAPGDHKQQAYPRSTSDIFTAPWPSAGSSNVWGSSGIGNGTFATPLSGLPQIPNSMSRPQTSARISPPQTLGQSSASTGLAQPPGFGDSRPNALDTVPNHFMPQTRAAGTSPTPGLGRQQHVPGPIAPPSRSQPPREQRSDDRAKAGGWNSFAIDGQMQHARAAAAAQATVAVAGPPTVLEEVFKKTSASSRLGGPRTVEQVQHVVHDNQGSRTISAPPSTQTQPAATSTASATSGPASESTVRLPGASAQQPLHAQLQAVSLPPSSESKEQSPPPPEAASQSVNASAAKHPHVCLPRPAPVVKLPPASLSAEYAAASQHSPGPVRYNPVGIGARPLVQSEAWANRFNVLFNRTAIHTETPPSPPKTPPKANVAAALTVLSSTKDDLEVASTASATVSLPQQTSKEVSTGWRFTVDGSGDITSKPDSDAIFVEERDFGSTPRIRVPRHINYPDMRFEGNVNLLHMGTNSRMQTGSKFQLYDLVEETNLFPRDPRGCFINIKGVSTRHNPIYWKGTRDRARPSARPQKARASHGPTSGKDSSTSIQGPNSAAGTAAPGSRSASLQKAPVKENVSAVNKGSPGNGDATDVPQKQRSGSAWAMVPKPEGGKRRLPPAGLTKPLPVVGQQV